MKKGLLDQLIEAWTFLPGVGYKTARRFVYYMLEHNRDGAAQLAELIQGSLEKIKQCQNCRMFSESDQCWVCRDNSRDRKTLCVVETPSAMMAIEANTNFRGTYFVLHGRLSPLDGIGPDDIGLDCMQRRIVENNVNEIILAVGATVEGNITAYVISEMAKNADIKITRLAQGLPAGGDLEFTDATTLSQAFDARVGY